jgi:choline dehydrogenase
LIHGKFSLGSPCFCNVLHPSQSYLTTEHDINVIVRGLKLAFGIAAAPPLSDSIDKTNLDPLLDHQLHLLDDSELVEVVRNRAETLYHPCSTARITPLNEGGVVNPYLRVHGIPNLRVVDASVFPTIVAGHTVSYFRTVVLMNG